MKKITKNILLFSPKDIKQIEGLGLNLQSVKKQLDIYRKGPSFLKLNRPCRVRDGILSVNESKKNKLISLYDNDSDQYKLIKFVPASGAASRMFAEWFTARESGGFKSPAFHQSFLKKIKKYPFYTMIEQNKNAFGFLEQEDIAGLLDHVLSDKGLNFGWLPKALIPFHFYHTEDMRTALEEHFIEAAHYIRGADDKCNLHFTISDEHQKDVHAKIKTVKSRYEELLGIKYSVSLSVQSPSTKTLAVDENNRPLRDTAGRLVFRPGGHGSLLKNLQNLDADFIFIKNIDNIVPERFLKEIVPYKKMLGGLAMVLRKEIFESIRRLKNNKISASEMGEIIIFCSKKLNIVFPKNFAEQAKKRKIKFLLSVLDRPLRVCAMVRNEGEPGGGPFWVEGNNKTFTLQIVEGAHVDGREKNQLKIWSGARYFNPVDMVCSIRNYQGKNFDLSKYVDNGAYLISQKHEKGHRIKALEVPGLWNGAMAYWNTVFVNLPVIVFNPVKNVDDLLRPRHLVQ